MGAGVGFSGRTGDHFSIKRLLFSPVPGLFFSKQPVYHHPLGNHHVFGPGLPAATANTICVEILSAGAGRYPHHNE